MIFNNFIIDVNCPRCSYILCITSFDIRHERIVFCHNCKISISLIDKDASFLRGSKLIESALDSIKEVFNEFKN
jgi:hypothetical protein